MSRTRKIGLRIDDPLSSTDVDTSGSPPRLQNDLPETPMPDEPATDTRPATRRPLQRRAKSAEPTGPTTDRAVEARPGRCWRSWSGCTRVASYRLPDELLAEVAEAADALGLPVGLIVTAAITHLLDESATAIAELVDRADDARIHGRRVSRRDRAQERDAHSTAVERPSSL